MTPPPTTPLSAERIAELRDSLQGWHVQSLWPAPVKITTGDFIALIDMASSSLNAGGDAGGEELVARLEQASITLDVWAKMSPPQGSYAAELARIASLTEESAAAIRALTEIPTPGTGERTETGRWITQDRFYDQATGAKGNCLQAAVASLLGMPLSAVPHFIQEHESAHDIWEAVDAFFDARGFCPWTFYRNEQTLAIAAPDVFYLASGDSPRGISHCVIMRAGKLVHDPHPSRAGLLNVREIRVPMAKDAAIKPAPLSPPPETEDAIVERAKRGAYEDVLRIIQAGREVLGEGHTTIVSLTESELTEAINGRVAALDATRKPT